MSSYMEQQHHHHEGDEDRISDSTQQQHVRITQSTIRYVLCAALNSCNLGYDIGVSTQVGRLVQDDLGLTRVQRELYIGSINFWAMLGALAAQFVTDRYGRRRTFLTAAILFILGVATMSASRVYATLMIGRMLVGWGVGVGLAIDPLYIAEISPAQYRGELVTWAEIALNVGILLGFSTGLILAPMDDSREWRAMLAFGGFLPTVMIFLVVFVMPESPRWLVAKHREPEAMQVLQDIYPPGYQIDLVMQDMKASLARENAAEGALSWKAVLCPSPAFRRMLVVGVGIAVAQQAVGIDAIQNYLLDVLDETGIAAGTRQNGALFLLGLVKLCFIIVGGKLFDTWGRRPLFFASLIGMAAALLMISIIFYTSGGKSSVYIVIGLAIYLASFSVGMGPGAWLIPSEVFSLSIRAKAMSISTVLNRAVATLMSSTFLSTANAMGWGGYFLMLFFICCIVLVFVYMLLPETKGRSLEDMTMYFADITNDRTVLDAEEKIQQQAPSVELAPTPGID